MYYDSYCLTIISILLFQHEAQLIEDGITLSGFQQTSSRFESSDDDYADSDDTTTEQQYIRPAVFHPRIPVNKLSVIPPLRIKRERELKRRPQQNGWVFKRVWCLSIFFLLVTIKWMQVGTQWVVLPPSPLISFSFHFSCFEIWMSSFWWIFGQPSDPGKSKLASKSL